MKIFLRNSLFLFLFVFSVRGEVNQGNEIVQSFKAARHVFEEGLFDVADQRLTTFLKTYPDSNLADEAHLLDAQALYYLGRYDSAFTQLQECKNENDLRPEILFWEGESLLAQQKWSLAESKYRELESKFPKNVRALDSQLSLAWSLFKQNREREANDVLAQLGIDQSDTEIGQRALLTLAKFQISKNQFADASAKLELILKQDPKPEIFFQASYWSGELDYADKKYDEAVAQYSKLTSDKKAFPKFLVAQAWFGLGQTYRQLNQLENALDAFEHAYTLTDEEEMKLASFKLYLECARSLQRLPEAISRLTEFSKKNEELPDAAAAFFAIARSQEENGDLDKASASFEQLLAAYPKSRWRFPAQFELGKMSEKLNKPDLAIKALQNCIEGNDDLDLVNSARFELGKIYYGENANAKAAAQFSQLANGQGVLAEESSYDLLLIEASQNQLDAFLKTLDQFTTNFPQSKYTDQIILLKGNLQERLGQVDQARLTYEKALLGATTELQKAILSLRIADLSYQSGKIEEASQLYENFLKDFPKSPAFPEAAFKGIMADLTIKKIPEDQGITALLALWKKFPDDPLAPQILFQAAEFYFNRQDYGNAEIQFAQLGKQYPKSSLADAANYWAGVSAAAQGDAVGAIPLLEKVAENSAFKIDARLMQSKIYYQQMKFENALTLLDAILNSEKNGSKFVEATLRRGDCYFALGDKGSGNYEKAAADYGVIVNGDQGTLAQRNEAGFRRAKCLEKLNRTEDALALYLDVFYGRLTTTAVNQPAPPEFLWKIKAGLEAARIKEEDKDWHGAIQIYKGLEDLGGPGQNEFQEVINRIRRDHYLYE